MPEFHIPEITLERVFMLIGPAFVIAMLGGIESLLSAVVADGMTNSKHNSNRELIGQGIANIVTPFLEEYLQQGRLHERLQILNPVLFHHYQG